VTAGAPLAEVAVVARPRAARGILFALGLAVRCALGRSGVSAWKREGDGATPIGAFHPIALLYRADRLPRPRTRLPVTAIDPGAGWCDDPDDRAYNRPVRLPYPASHEHLWRKDSLYDLVVVLDYNLAPTIPGRGSAIFLHLAGADLAPTAGCIAVSPIAMRRLLPRLAPSTVITVR